MHFSEIRLQQAFAQCEFIPFYQPVIHADTGKVAGCEVLARWLNPEKGLLEAGTFIHSIETTGLSELLTRTLANKVIPDIYDLHNGRTGHFMLTMNISLSQIMAPGFRAYLVTLNNQLRQTGVIPVFEITEREDIRDFTGAADVLAGLTGDGLCFAVDDYGTGYAGETLLAVSRAAFIKLGCQVAADLTDPVTQAFVTDTVRLARSSGARVIAEGVETAEQAKQLQDCGVDYLQGFLYGAAMPFGLFHYRLGAMSPRRSVYFSEQGEPL
ncbi:EAL domain-containing protein [Citrobacter amalonaticus]|uniref:EAL domain-containing protein n=1 Tax=Citrobacter amalonaticus TaxID=35703 RepID=A0A2S4RXL7_CITAM|nr:EAL domain-containing protein [Citrobacter amalonaticus]POT56156.1 EAL domain-containing protein [Citrobacter amalonaticus]POT74465.1 EAL domain-containing protein [Citrobacter amalonaticus]POU65264.1 EAL domain-containing protein [Citrobacter amalonaticus]POV04099.1 EAL domain-containing protein [Citrobacter amalonaticus]